MKKFWTGKCVGCETEYWARLETEPNTITCHCKIENGFDACYAVRFHNPKESIPVDGIPPDLTDQVENAVISIANSLDKIQQRLELSFG